MERKEKYKSPFSDILNILKEEKKKAVHRYMLRKDILDLYNAY